MAIVQSDLSYVLITPARNEEKFINEVIQSVAAQSVLPRRYVIVSDGSTDRTDEIVRNWCARLQWLNFVRLPEHADRHFAAKVNAFKAGQRLIQDMEYDIIGNLDADITFDADYFEYLLAKFKSDPLLGVAGTPFLEGTRHYNYQFTNIEHVSGACQLFRRECYEAVGGYTPIKGGGIDWAAVTTARMKGWHTRTFTGRVCIHHRKMGTGSGSVLGSWFRHGRKDYCLGGHPVWQCFRVLHQLSNRPYVIGGLLLGAGYTWAWATRTRRDIPAKLVRFHRDEQMSRLRRFLPSAKRT